MILNFNNLKVTDDYQEPSAETLKLAKDVARAIPSTYTVPNVYVTLHGEINFSWETREGKMLTLSLHQNKLLFAGIVEKGYGDYGAMDWNGEFPGFVADWLKENAA